MKLKVSIEGNRGKVSVLYLVARINGRKVLRFSSRIEGKLVAVKGKQRGSKIEFANYEDEGKFNDLINEFSKWCNRYYDDNELAPTREAIRGWVDVKFGITDSSNRFLDDYKAFFIEDSSIKESTRRNRAGTYNALKEYQRQSRSNLTYDSITVDFERFFRGFMSARHQQRSKKAKPMTTNSINKHLQNIAAFMRKRGDIGIHSNTQYKAFNTRLTGSKDAIALEAHEVASFEDANLAGDLDQIRDLFLMLVYTGQRVSDLNKLIPDNIVTDNGTEVISFIQDKSVTQSNPEGSIVQIPINSKMRAIWAKYPAGLPVIKLDDFNNGIRTIAGKFMLSERAAQLSSHTGRRTFATLAYDELQSAATVMSITGHKRETIFFQYIKRSPTRGRGKIVEFFESIGNEEETAIRA